MSDDGRDLIVSRCGVPARSRLYHLAPVGVGTPDTESLTGYIARLAHAHCVQVGVLVAREIGPGLAERGVHSVAQNNWAHYSEAMNGTGATARALVDVMEALTRREDVRFLTLLSWVHVVPPARLLRPVRAWCPACYHDWRAEGRTIYEPLLWSLTVAAACPHHGHALQVRCPHQGCGAQQHPLAARMRPGHCSRCLRWLGQAAAGSLTAAEMRPTFLPDTRVTAVGELLAIAPTLPTPPTRGQVAGVLDALTRDERRAAVGQAACVSKEQMSMWRRGRHLPTLPAFLRLCASLGITPVDVVAAAVGMTTVRAADLIPQTTDETRSRVARRPIDHNDVRRAVQALLDSLDCDEDPPPSLRHVAQRLGYSGTILQRACPDLSTRIAEQHRAYRRTRRRQREEQIRGDVRRAVFQLHGQGIYPSNVQVGRLLRAPGYLRAEFAAAAWREAMQELGLRQS